ncbi:hypothetical protein [Leptolyngbya phage Lbo-JY46]
MEKKPGTKIVTTYTGEQAKRSDCKKIKGKYYVLNKDCFFLEGQWYRVDSPHIFYDYTLKRYSLQKNRPADYIKGVADVKNGKFVYGWFKENPYENVVVEDPQNDSRHVAINKEILIYNNLVEHLSTGVFVYKNTSKGANSQSITNVIDHKVNGYNIEDNTTDLVHKTRLYNEYNPKLPKNVISGAKFIKGITFGLELESLAGFMPENLQNQTGIVICRDGSLGGGPEYTTIPLSGAKGLQTILNISEYLGPRNLLNESCSLHIHIGNLDLSRSFIIALYRLCFQIQEDVFKMFPYYKTDYRVAKEKDYNKKLSTLNISNFDGHTKEDYDNYINNNYKSLFMFLTNGIEPGRKYNRNTRNHPQSQKWNRPSRYYWVNFMNCFFSKRNTVEFRLHHGTFNAYKIVNWLLICNAIVRFAKANIKTLLVSNKKHTIEDVLSYYSDTFKEEGCKLVDYLMDYYTERVNTFKDQKDKTGQKEFSQDHSYTFKSSKGYNFIF